ncbi:MAG: phage tail protein [Terasakiella sp.]|uniref:phage tail protein n=1 Tax=unclassified Terasakiella TaxID=2614952 RepID=UPI003B00328D
MIRSFTQMARCTGIALGFSSLAFFTSSHAAFACAENDYIASICVTSSNWCPDTYVPATGQLLPIQDYSALFQTMGTTYGGDGRSVFRLPDLRSRTVVGIGGPLNIQQGQMLGSETITLKTENLPPHTHKGEYTSSGSSAQIDVHVSQTPAEKEIPEDGDMLAQPPLPGFVPNQSEEKLVKLGGVHQPVSAPTIQETGTGIPVDITNPEIAALYCIKIKGNFPPHPN